MDQNAVDALLNQIQTQADQINQQVSPPAPAAGGPPVAGPPPGPPDTLSASLSEIAGEMEGPPGGPGRHASAGPADPSLAGEFAAPLGAPVRAAQDTADAGRLLAIEVPVIVQLGNRRMTVGEVMRLAVGAIVEFNKSAEEELELLINNKPIGKGQAVKVGENFGIKITSIGSVKETIRKLGGA